MSVQQSKHVAYMIIFVIKTSVLTYTVNIVLCIQVHRDASIQTRIYCSSYNVISPTESYSRYKHSFDVWKLRETTEPGVL